MQLRTVNCACISVGNPGNGAVTMSTGLILFFVISNEIDFSFESITAPTSIRVCIIAPIRLGSILLIVISPFVRAAATRYVPASILSAGIVKDVPLSFSTPSILISSVPAPEILAPIEFKKSARSDISGSLATFVRIVTPSANEAAIIKFSVPVTVTPSNSISAPISFSALASIYPLLSDISAPSFSSAFK